MSSWFSLAMMPVKVAKRTFQVMLPSPRTTTRTNTGKFFSFSTPPAAYIFPSRFIRICYFYEEAGRRSKMFHGQWLEHGSHMAWHKCKPPMCRSLWLTPRNLGTDMSPQSLLSPPSICWREVMLSAYNSDLNGSLALADRILILCDELQSLMDLALSIDISIMAL